MRNPGFDAKVAMLLANQYKCFQKETKESKRDTSNHGRWASKVATPPPRPVRLVRPEPTPEAATQKAFMSLMNKLTDKNKVAIFAQVAKLPLYIEIQSRIVWDICLVSPSYQSLYMQVFDLLMDKSDNGRELVVKHLENRLAEYLETTAYLPPDTIDSTEYDDFCDYVKWKKRSIAHVTMLMLLESKGLLTAVEPLTAKLLESCDTLLTGKDFEKADVVLDQISQIFTGGVGGDAIPKFIDKWLPSTDAMKPSTRFKFYTFQDIIYKKINATRSHKTWTPVSSRHRE